MIEFLTQYWKLIAAGVLIIFDLVVVLLNCRKPVKVFDSVHQSILKVLPSLINAAEGSYVSGHGQDKLSMVKELVYNYLVNVYGISVKEAIKYEGFIEKNVEEILSTPRKKDVK